MRRTHSESQARIAIAALNDADGYVEALLGLAREQTLARQAILAGALLASGRTHEPRPMVAPSLKLH